MRTLFIVNLFSTLYMVGLIWMVQVVHYPLMNRVSAERFAAFEREHQRLTTRVVLPPMLVELFTAAWLVVRPPRSDMVVFMWIGLGLVIGLWAATFFVSVPCHTALEQQFDAEVHARLVRTNWLRTWAWSVRGALMCWVTAKLMQI